MINKAFAFDRVFDQDTDQITVYQAVVGPLIKEVLMGYNCTVFAYGQTGTGKTYTMEGERSDKAFSWDEDPQAGIIPRSLHQLFDELCKEENVEFSVHVSFLELYNEELFDLLSPNELQVSKLRLFEDSSRKGSVVIQGLEEIKVNSKDEVYSILEKGTMRRQKACTNLNAASSRSHTVFSVTVHIKENTIEGEDLLKTGKLNLVDLAGSENIGRSGATQKTAREAGNINQSLLTLGRVITALVEKAPHVPYRESKLTRLLQDSLGGHTKTSIIATVSPAQCNIEETISTLEYAQRAKSITIKPEINQKMTKKALIKEYTEEIERLRKDLAAARDKSGFFIHAENYNSMQQDIITKESDIEELKLKIEALTAQKEKFEKLFSETKCKYKRTRQELSKKSKVLDNTQKKLSKIALELDETRFIFNIQTKTEEQLSCQAQTLLQVTDKITHDVGALHNKIDRKKNIEKTNEERSQEFRASFQKKLATCHDTVSHMYEEQVGNLNEVRSINGNILELCKTLLDVSAFEDFHIQSASLINQNEQHINASAVDCVDFCASCAEKVSILKNQNKQHHDDLLLFKEKYVLKSSRSLSSMQDLMQLLCQMQEKTITMGKQFETYIESLMTTFEQQLHDMSSIFDSCVKMLTEHMVTNNEKVSLIQSEYEQNQQKLNEKVAGKWAELLAVMNHHEQDFKTVVSAAISDFQCSNNQIVEASYVQRQQKNKIVADYATEKTEKKKDCDVLSQDFIYQENQNKQVQNICRSVISEQEEEKQDVESYFQSSERHTNSDAQTILKIDEMVNNRTSDVLKKREQYQEHIKKNKCSIEKKATEYKIMTEKRASSLVSHIDHQSAVISKIENELSGYSETTKKELLNRDLELQQFFEEKLQKDMPTGTTPERQEYVFPRKFAATSPHDRILNRFRSQLATNEAIAMDLPLGSNLDNSFDDNSPPEVGSKFGTNCLSVPRICYSSDEANGFDSDESLSSQSDVLAKSKKNKENQRSAHKASKLPRRKNLPKKGFAKPQASASQRKPLTVANEVIQA